MSKKQFTNLAQSVLGLSRPVAYYPELTRAFGSLPAAVLVSQLLYWTARSKSGWVYKTQKDREQETGLSRDQQDSARKVLKKFGVLDEQLAGVPAKVHFRLNLTALKAVLAGSKQDCGKSAIQFAGNQQTITESTPESTSQREHKNKQGDSSNSLEESTADKPSQTSVGISENSGGGFLPPGGTSEKPSGIPEILETNTTAKSLGSDDGVPPERLLSSSAEYVEELPHLLVDFGIPKDVATAIALADKSFLEAQGYPVIDWDRQANFWMNKLDAREGYADLLRCWGEYCMAHQTQFDISPDKSEFSRATQQQIRTFLWLVGKSKSRYEVQEVWGITRVFMKWQVANVPRGILSFRMLLKPKTWYKYDDDANDAFEL